MDAVRFGADVRLLRARRGWTQVRLAAEAKVSRWAIVEVEGGRGARIAATELIRIVAALGGYLSIRILYQGEGLDRLRDRRHAQLVERMIARLRVGTWEVATEVSFNVYGERGSIDILAFDSATGTLLIIEVKTVIPDVGGMLATIDRKVRLAPDLVVGRGWEVRHVARLLVLPETSTVRRRIADHAATFENAFPARNVEVNRWLRKPGGPISALMFLPSAPGNGTRRRDTAAPVAAAQRPRTDPA